jgi:hypothetical protein
LAQGQVIERELAVTADEEGKESEQVEHEGDHEPRLWPDWTDRRMLAAFVPCGQTQRLSYRVTLAALPPRPALIVVPAPW